MWRDGSMIVFEEECMFPVIWGRRGRREGGEDGRACGGGDGRSGWTDGVMNSVGSNVSKERMWRREEGGEGARRRDEEREEEGGGRRELGE